MLRRRQTGSVQEKKKKNIAESQHKTCCYFSTYYWNHIMFKKALTVLEQAKLLYMR